ncbi:hypothetical protein J2Z43_000432 [Clostridioides mangenotii]|uniref:Sigma factor regulator N-terminal domain-containing protein n=1 Tax=Metaclostridioides mangenotii TaxID=1540 RepID=A0ABS4E7Z0_9FIRM|nr:hypothetical protein [Clostridioides mangenotii]
MSILIVGVLTIYNSSNYFAKKQSDLLNEELNIYNVVAEPNISVDYQTLYNNNSFGGEIHVSRSKKLMGILYHGVHSLIAIQ